MKLSVETSSILKHLRYCVSVGKVATYENINDEVGFDVLERRYPLVSAIKIMQKDYGMIACNIPGVGYKFSNGSEAVKKIDNSFSQRIKSTIRNTQDKVSSLDWGKLDSDDMKKAIAVSIKTAAHDVLTQPGFQQKVLETAFTNNRFLDSAKEAARLMKAIG